MAITLDGTSGITTPDVNSDGLTVDTTTLVVDEANNRVGIGTSSPSNRLSVVSASGSDGFISISSPTSDTAGVLVNGGTDSNKGAIVRFQKNATTKWTMGTDSAIIGGTSDNFHLYGGGANAILFSTNASERARIDSSGNLLVGTTSSIGGVLQVMNDSTGRIINTRSFNTSNQYHHAFENNSGTLVGNITATTTSTVYNTSSDYRLKEDWQPMSGAITRLNQLNPVNFAWKLNGSRVDGFLAHEVQDVVPEAITGTKDEVDAEGNPVYQGIDQSKLVPLLTAALQEALGKIETLEARVAALEAA